MDDVISPGIMPMSFGQVFIGEIRPDLEALTKAMSSTNEGRHWTFVQNGINAGGGLPWIPDPYPFMPWPPTTIVSTGLPASKFSAKLAGDALTLSLDVPGVKKGTLDVQVRGYELSVAGVRDDTKVGVSEKYFVTSEYDTDPSSIEARHEDGVLTITFQKKKEPSCRIKVK